MSEFGGLWKHKNNQHALVPPKTECGCPSGGGIKNGHIRYPAHGRTQKNSNKNNIHFTHIQMGKYNLDYYFTWINQGHQNYQCINLSSMEAIISKTWDFHTGEYKENNKLASYNNNNNNGHLACPISVEPKELTKTMYTEATHNQHNNVHNKQNHPYHSIDIWNTTRENDIISTK